MAFSFSDGADTVASELRVKLVLTTGGFTAPADGAVSYSSGKVRSVGVSNFRPWDWELLQSAMTSRLVTNQIEISSATAHFPPFIKH